jgi:hypothetical protein
MRYLNKIIFLNSAHIPYAEVKLDGNVHFIGTQGVGKSTLLRALLFFYNADKLRLGIPKEKKSFDAFYFPYPNSYIVYEVMRENGAYCVLALKNQGRVMFRFIDAPFDSKWFIDERKQVYGEWSQIREQVGKKHDISSLVSSYEMYRDIIFGNNRRQELLSFRKYAIVESAKYQNIPRTIQNVFLNTKLDADFIKNTIIRSMSDEDNSIVLLMLVLIIYHIEVLDNLAFYLQQIMIRLVKLKAHIIHHVFHPHIHRHGEEDGLIGIYHPFALGDELRYVLQLLAQSLEFRFLDFLVHFQHILEELLIHVFHLQTVARITNHSIFYQISDALLLVFGHFQGIVITKLKGMSLGKHLLQQNLFPVKSFNQFIYRMESPHWLVI